MTVLGRRRLTRTDPEGPCLYVPDPTDDPVTGLTAFLRKYHEAKFSETDSVREVDTIRELDTPATTSESTADTPAPYTPPVPDTTAPHKQTIGEIIFRHILANPPNTNNRHNPYFGTSWGDVARFAQARNWV